MSAVLKSSDQQFRTHRFHAFNLDDLEVLAGRILQGARAKARELLRDAHLQAEQIRVQAAETARREGLEQGRLEGAHQGREQALADAAKQFAEEQKELLSTLQDTLERFESEQNQLLSDARDDVIRLAIGIARRVTKRYAAGDTEVAVENLREVIERVGQSHIAQIVVNPADAESIRKFASGLVGALDRVRQVTVTESDQVEPGGCLVRLPEGQIDASVETQLDRIAQALLPGEQQE